MTEAPMPEVPKVPRYEDVPQGEAIDDYPVVSLDENDDRPYQRRRDRLQTEWASLMQKNLANAERLASTEPSVEFPMDVIAAMRTNLLLDQLLGGVPSGEGDDTRIPMERLKYELEFEKVMAEQILKAEAAQREARQQQSIVKPKTGDNGLILPQ